jgi:phosphatidylglycerol---prolipoprotein diacylglyceryl transferase
MPSVTFPVLIPLGPWRLHPHAVFETLAYAIGFQIYLVMRRRGGDIIEPAARWSVIVAAAVGAALGSRLLAALEQPEAIVQYWHQPLVLFGGKTIVGGLIGGLIAVEWTKRRIGVTTRTGDLFALPLAIGIAVGRIGCFLTGLDDGTFGSATTAWTGIDFGDGIRRHPTQLYEIVFLILLACVLAVHLPRLDRTGDRFRVFMIGYFGFRLAVDALKPPPPIGLGLSAIQWACLAMLLYYVPDIRRWTTPRRSTAIASLR